MIWSLHCPSFPTPLQSGPDNDVNDEHFGFMTMMIDDNDFFDDDIDDNDLLWRMIMTTMTSESTSSAILAGRQAGRI